MNIAEILLSVIGLSMNVFLTAQYEGSMVQSVRWKKLSLFAMIFFIWQIGSCLLGFLVSRVPVFDNLPIDLPLKQFCYFMAALLLLLIASYMLYRAVHKGVIFEHRREISFRRVFLEATLIAVFTFLVGVGWGFIGHSILMTTAVLSIATVLAVISGFYMGYAEGCKYHYGIYGIGGALLAFVGVDILVRYL